MASFTDPRLEGVARTVCRIAGGNPDTDWREHVDMAAGYLKTFDNAEACCAPSHVALVINEEVVLLSV